LEHNAKPSVKNNAKKLFAFCWHYYIISVLKKQAKCTYFTNQTAVSLVFFLCLIFILWIPAATIAVVILETPPQ